ncbi:MAG: ABC transporter permease [Bacteroidetes bacterium]|nr:MAG: ABC transporter permease [Bacteroidota bacterium]
MCQTAAGGVEAPVAAQILEQWGWKSAHTTYVDWYGQDYAWAWWPPIAYGPRTSDLSAGKLLSPFADQQKSWRFRHWLGTDQLGYDVAAKLIWGTRTSLVVGLGAAFLAGIIGLLLGAPAAYFGDDKKRISLAHLGAGGAGLFLGAFWGFVSRYYLVLEGHLNSYLLGGLCILSLMTLMGIAIGSGLMRYGWGIRQFRIPLDSMVMRLVETLNAIPALILLLAFVAVVREPSLRSVVLILGLLGWTPMARFVRGELLRIRNMEYIEAAQSFGFSDARILWQHALPNALGSVYIIVAFSIAGAIIAEASLSFLGIGIPADTATWGGALASARQASASAWWLAVFPGLAIFVTVTIFNLLGDELSE